MHHTSVRRRRALTLAVIAAALAIVFVSFASADSQPIGKLPAGPVVTVAAAQGELVSMALPRTTGGKVWRIARNVDAKVLRQVAQADVSSGPVVVFRAVGKGHAIVRFALTRGDASGKALAARTLAVTVG